jgi:hypothetical protein
MKTRQHVAMALVLVFMVSTPLSVFAEIKTLIAEATYTMGDGETPSFAEAQVLQRAKQTALEQAGTYVKSYTKAQNLNLTTEEIQTIAGGVLEVEILEKGRKLVGDGLSFSIKIKAAVTTDKMEELARRIKGKNVAGEYTKLQADYARLSRELETWKQRAAKIPRGSERAAAVDQIRDREKAFALVQQREADLFRRLISGQQLVEQASSDQEIMDRLIEMILTHGYIVTVGDAKAMVVSDEPDQLAINVPLTLQLSETLQDALSIAANELGGTYKSYTEVSLSKGDSLSAKNPLRIGKGTRENANIALVRMGKYLETAMYFQDAVMRLAFLVTFLDGTDAPPYCLLGPKFLDQGNAFVLEYGSDKDNWFSLRRIFPVSLVQPPIKYTGYERTGDAIDNGQYDSARLYARDPYFRSDIRDLPRQWGYVAVVRDEATFITQHRLPALAVANLTGVSVRALSLSTKDELYRTAPRCTLAQ